MDSRPARHVHRWHDEVLADRVVAFAGPDVAVVRVHPCTVADEPDTDRRVWRATALSATRKPVPVNTAVSQILAHLIRDHYPSEDWSQSWDYHVQARRLLEPGHTGVAAQKTTG